VRRHGVVRRMTAALLAAIQVGGCAGLRVHEEGAGSGGWLHPEGIAPADVVNEWHPDRLRVTRADSTIVELSQPASRGDTLVGWRTIRARTGTFAFDRSDVLALEVRGLGATLTLRDSSIIDIEKLWERSDSLGGAGKRRTRRAFVAIRLAEVARVEVRHIPKPPQHPAAPTGRLALSRGETIRVFVGEATAPEWQMVAYRGTFREVADASLVLAADTGLVHLPLAHIQGIEVLAGRHGHALTGLLVGLLAGGAGAAVLGATHNSDRPLDGYAVVLGGGLMVIGGAAIGTLAGALSHSDRWREVALPQMQHH
jgi:hypothetical protein